VTKFFIQFEEFCLTPAGRSLSRLQIWRYSPIHACPAEPPLITFAAWKNKS
jgi:hypothetical protein